MTQGGGGGGGGGGWGGHKTNQTLEYPIHLKRATMKTSGSGDVKRNHLWEEAAGKTFKTMQGYAMTGWKSRELG